MAPFQLNRNIKGDQEGPAAYIAHPYAISNDGDALFPAIAIAPRAAILATIYSAIPAFIMAYTLYFFFPLFGQ